MNIAWRAAAALLLMPAALAHAAPDEPSRPVGCDAPEAPELTGLDIGLTSAFILASVSAEFLSRPPSTARWRGGILFDDDTRDLMRLSSPRARKHARLSSDVLELVVLVGLPLTDAGFAIGRGQLESAGRMLFIDVEAISAALTLVSITKNLVGRERPYQRHCASIDPDDACGSADSRRSFYSGHAALAWTAAGLVCIQHAELDLFGGGAADTATCVFATTVATTVSLLRVAADEHYASDVLAGAALGVFSGWILPRLLHYGWQTAPRRASRIAPLFGPELVGLSASGTF